VRTGSSRERGGFEVCALVLKKGKQTNSRIQRGDRPLDEHALDLRQRQLTTIACVLIDESATVTACISYICLSEMEMNIKNWRRK
jgi:hypothetical protein